ncbi:MAG: hypothetical protein IJ614_02005 [Prevotella sp.]|nr:hypothetical protein [Prevotella sp.]
MKKLLLITLIAGLSSCSAIDDNLDDCDTSFQLDYELRLVTNMNTELRTELQTELSTQTELSMANALRGHLSNIFTDFAHDVDLSFYDTQGDSVRLQHDEHVMNANQASYSLFLPMRQYMHLATANVVDNPVVTLTTDEYCHKSRLSLLGNQLDTISSHTTGVFTARQPMEVLSGVDQTFNVKLYMANCAATLVVDTVGSGIRDMKVYTTGFATAFNLADSTYVYSTVSPVVRTEQVTDNTARGLMAFCSVNFPSPEVPLATAGGAPAQGKHPTRSVLETEEPFVSGESTDALWEIHVYATTATGSITQTKLYVRKPLRAGQLKIIKAKTRPDGEVSTHDQTVGVNVTLNWNTGGGYEPEL